MNSSAGEDSRVPTKLESIKEGREDKEAYDEGYLCIHGVSVIPNRRLSGSATRILCSLLEQPVPCSQPIPERQLEADLALQPCLAVRRMICGVESEGRAQEKVFGGVLEPDEEKVTRYGLIGGVNEER
jgi:hypothetical protein